MGQEGDARSSFSAADDDLENDPVLAPLRSHRTSGRGRRVAVAVVLVGLLAAGGWYAHRVYESRSREAEAERIRAQAEPEPTPAPSPSPVQRAEGWCVENLGATEFAGLPVVEGENGRFFVIYAARASDSIGAVVKRYGAGLGSDSRGEILELAKLRHGERYGGRGLWVGDELRLLVPIGPRG